MLHGPHRSRNGPDEVFDRHNPEVIILPNDNAFGQVDFHGFEVRPRA